MKAFLYILKTILYGWIGAAKELFAIICKLYRRWRSQKGKGRVVATTDCVPIYDPAFVKPDPLIYDQYYLTSLGLAVTWDNPDIQLYLNGAPVSSSLLAPGTTYEVVAQIWNNSTDSPAVAMPVNFSFLEFGISTARRAAAIDNSYCWSASSISPRLRNARASVSRTSPSTTGSPLTNRVRSGSAARGLS